MEQTGFVEALNEGRKDFSFTLIDTVSLPGANLEGVDFEEAVLVNADLTFQGIEFYHGYIMIIENAIRCNDFQQKLIICHQTPYLPILFLPIHHQYFRHLRNSLPEHRHVFLPEFP